MAALEVVGYAVVKGSLKDGFDAVFIEQWEAAVAYYDHYGSSEIIPLCKPHDSLVVEVDKEQKEGAA